MDYISIFPRAPVPAASHDCPADAVFHPGPVGLVEVPHDVVSGDRPAGEVDVRVRDGVLPEKFGERRVPGHGLLARGPR